MNGRDSVATLLGALDGPVAPRPEFADALLAQLLDELGHGRAPAMPAARWRRRFAARLVPAASPRLRLALIVIAMLLLAAALAAAAVYFGGRWLSAEPRGIQYSAKFDLTLVMRTPREEALWTQWRLGPGGHDVYVLRHPREPGPSGKEMDLMRVPAVATASRPVRPERFLASAELADPELWEPGVDLTGAAIGPYLPPTPGISGWDALAVADNGDVFVVAGAWEKAGEDDPAAPPIATSLIVRHGDGRMERVLSIDELELSVPERDVELHVAASAPGRLWLMAWELRSGRVSPAGPYGPYSFFEVRDPDGDGDWADRTVRRLALPRSLPVYDRGADGRQQTFLTQIVAEPPLRGQAPSLLVASLDRGERFRVHRIADRNGDGDALDGDEVRGVVDERPSHLDDAAPAIAARVLDGEREIVAAGLTRRTRVSIVSSSGRVTDVARAFEHLEPAVLAGPGGRLYAPAQVPGRRGSSWRLYRLEPAQQGSRAAARPPSAPRAAAPASGTSRDVARIAFTIKSGDFRRGRIVLVRADGKGRPVRLVAGEHNDGFCQSADGKRMAYYSDEEAPHEQFLYVAGSDGSNPRKVTERSIRFWCRFSTRWLLIGEGDGQSSTLLRHDLETGREVRLAEGVDRLALSPDGRSVVFVGGLRFPGGAVPRGRETLELVDLATLRRRRLAGPLARRSFGTLSGRALQWFEDGSKVAYAVGPKLYPQHPERRGTRPVRYSIRVQPVPGGSARTVMAIRGGPPTLSLSPRGDRLLVCLPDRPHPRHDRVGCGGSGTKPRDTPRGRLVLLNPSTGLRARVARGRLHFADWMPHGGGFAYATGKGVFLVEDAVRAVARRIARRPRGGWPVGGWLGFSPDGRYIGLGDFSRRLVVLDLKGGRFIVLARERGGRLLMYRKWWR